MEGENKKMSDMLEKGFEIYSSRRVFFLICDDCYWCASAIKSITFTKCPQCAKLLTIMTPFSRPTEKGDEEGKGIASMIIRQK
jgi:hypothetical protein